MLQMLKWGSQSLAEQLTAQEVLKELDGVTEWRYFGLYLGIPSSLATYYCSVPLHTFSIGRNFFFGPSYIGSTTVLPDKHWYNLRPVHTTISNQFQSGLNVYSRVHTDALLSNPHLFGNLHIKLDRESFVMKYATRLAVWYAPKKSVKTFCQYF